MKRTLIIAAIMAVCAAQAADVVLGKLSDLTFTQGAGANRIGQFWSPLTLGPVAWYKGDGNALDSSGNGYDGTWQVSEGYTNGVVSQAFALNGSRYVSIANNAALSGFDDFTIAGWVKTEGTTVASEYIFGTFSPVGNQRSWALIRLAPSGSYDCNLLVSSNGAPGSVMYPIPSASVFDGTWHHVAFVRSGVTVSSYLDGQVVGSVTFDGKLFASSSITAIGSIGSVGSYFNGAADELFLLNRALTPAEITQLYQWRQ